MPSSLEIPRFDPAALQLLRERAKLTKVEFGRRINVYENVIYRWEKGITPITAADLRRVAQELQIAPAQLQRPLDAPPTLVDLRSLVALTQSELAERLYLKLKRLILWEQGELGAVHESGALLAAQLGVGEQSIAVYEQTGRIPTLIARNLAQALRVTPMVAATAFLTSRRQRQADAQSA